jgi:hypothetical protein
MGCDYSRLWRIIWAHRIATACSCFARNPVSRFPPFGFRPTCAGVVANATVCSIPTEARESKERDKLATEACVAPLGGVNKPVLIYKDDMIIAERREDMLRVDTWTTPNCAEKDDGAWLSADEAVFLAKSIFDAFPEARNKMALDAALKQIDDAFGKNAAPEAPKERGSLNDRIFEGLTGIGHDIALKVNGAGDTGLGCGQYEVFVERDGIEYQVTVTPHRNCETDEPLEMVE